MPLFFLFFSCVGRVVTPIIEEEITIIEEDPLRVRAREIADSLDNRLLVSQVLISGTGGKEGMSVKMINLFTAIPAGGIMLFKYNLNTDNDTIHAHLAQIEKLIKNESNISPFIAVDHEGGTVNRFRRGVANLPAASSYYEHISQGRTETLSAIEADSLKAGKELHNLGITMNLAPVAEYLFDGNRKFLLSRSYGPDPFFTAQAAEAFIRGMEQAGVLCVVKHFPASAGPDPHRSPSVLDMDRAALDNLVSPFASLIKNGARAIMAAHTLAPSIDDKIASLSPAVMGNWLRGDLGFEGIIISDDFIMAAAGSTSPEEAAVFSIAAGADMILVWPDNLQKTHQAIITAIEDGRLSRDRLQDAAQRVIYEKLRMGLIDGE
ncbi:glycoside hydrolase family 3 N-terminal domain-containing protein [Treponema sp. R80B11-R83G3]